jgi:hypothetical protein
VVTGFPTTGVEIGVVAGEAPTFAGVRSGAIAAPFVDDEHAPIDSAHTSVAVRALWWCERMGFTTPQSSRAERRRTTNR